MVFEFKFPDVGEGIQEGEIVSWKVKIGDTVALDQVIAEVETDKAVVEIPTPQAGTVLKLHGNEGDTIAVGSTLITIGEKGEQIVNSTEKKVEKVSEKKTVATQNDAKISLQSESTLTSTAAEQSPKSKKKSGSFAVGDLPEPDDEVENSPNNSTSMLKPKTETSQSTHNTGLALPKTKKLAKEHNVNLAEVQGTGPGGRITDKDITEEKNTTEVKTAIQSSAKHVRKYDFFGFVERRPLKGMRKFIANKMMESLNTTAPVTHFDEADITLLHGLRNKVKDEYKEKGIHLTLLPFIMKAVIEGLKEFPALNSTLENEELILKKYYNIGIAVDTGDGLVVPVIKEAQDKGITAIAKEIQLYAEKAKNKKLDPMDMKGGSFTITNIGSIGGIFATPLINIPEAAILALGRGYEKPVSVKGELKHKFVLPLSLTFDHRILDGAEAARFINKVKEMLAQPELLLLEMDLNEE